MNNERETPLVINNELSKVAKEHALNMIRQRKFSHTLDGKSPQDRVRDADLCSPDTVVGENIGMVSGSIAVRQHTEEMFNGFKNSRGHYKNMTSEMWKITGVAYAVDEQNMKIFWVIMFANNVQKDYRIMPYYLQR